MRRLLMALVLVAAPALCGAAEQPRVFIEPSETVDVSGKDKDGAKHVDFGAALSAALVKKKVPVLVVTDHEKSQWTIRSMSSRREDSTGTKIVKIIAFGGGSFTEFEGTIQVIDNESSAVLYAYNVKKNNFQSAAESFAKNFKKYVEKR
jgi:hypothetical protein